MQPEATLLTPQVTAPHATPHFNCIWVTWLKILLRSVVAGIVPSIIGSITAWVLELDCLGLNPGSATFTGWVAWGKVTPLCLFPDPEGHLTSEGLCGFNEFTDRSA